MNTLRFAAVAFAALFVSACCHAQGLQLAPLVSFGTNGDGSIRPGERTYLTGDGTNRFQRGMAYNPTTGHVLIVNRSPIGAETINILDGVDGSDLGSLDLSSLTLGGNSSFILNLIGVADDGAIYVGNLSSANSPAEYRLYRWVDETSPQTLVYFGDPSNGDPNTANRRWGDTLAVRGAGSATEVLIASRGTLVSLLRPTDATMATFTSSPLTTSNPLGSLGHALAFGSGATFWGKGASGAGEALYRMGIDLDNGTAPTLQVYGVATFPGRVGALAVLPISNLLAGVEMVQGSDNTRLYDIANLANPPVLLDRQSFVSTNENTIFAAAAAIGDGRVYVLDADNGIVAYSLVASNHALAPSILLQPQGVTVPPGTNVTFTAAADGTAPLSFQWLLNSAEIAGATGMSFSLTNVQIADSGLGYRVVVSNLVGVVTSSIARLVVTTNLPIAVPGYDSFPYPAGQPLGTNGGWIVQSGTSGSVEAGNLNGNGLPASGGNRFSWGPLGLSHRLVFDSIFTSGTLYYSTLIRVDDLSGLTSTAGVVGGFAQGTTTVFAKLNIQSDGVGGYFLGASKRGSVNTYDTTKSYAVGETVFVVERYTFNSGLNDDVVDLWVNPDPSTFEADNPPSTPTVTVGADVADIESIDRFFFRGVAGAIPNKIVADELRVGTTWAQVTPRALARLAIRLTAPNVIVSWPTNATGYTLQNTAALTPPIAWTDVTTAPVVMGTNNTVTVGATGMKFFRLIK